MPADPLRIRDVTATLLRYGTGSPAQTVALVATDPVTGTPVIWAQVTR